MVLINLNSEVLDIFKNCHFDKQERNVGKTSGNLEEHHNFEGSSVSKNLKVSFLPSVWLCIES